MKGLFAQLTPEQKNAALEYDGPEAFGDPPLDIVARLRKIGTDEREIFRFGTRSWLLEAADEIERLRSAGQGVKEL